jgi:hypothetical protein
MPRSPGQYAPRWGGESDDPWDTGGEMQRVLQQMIGAQNAGGIGRDGPRPGMDFGGGSMGGGDPYGSNIPGSSYKTRGGAPRYHEQIPMGGTPGVYAIRNDEIGGPQQDAPWIEAARKRHGLRRSRFGR